MKQEALIDKLNHKDIALNIANTYHHNKSPKPINKRDFSFFHIEELTFEDESPRKEALENVLGTIGIDGVSFVYLLLGNENGVSFYFGIVKDTSYQMTLELDANEIGSYILKPSIEGNFRGSKITKVKDKQAILDRIHTMKRFARIDGVPSVNEENEGFQGVDRLVDIMSGDTFGLMVLADPLNDREISQIENALYRIYNKLSPLAKKNIQESKTDGTSQGETTGTNESQTNGTNNSVTETSSTTTGWSTSESTGGSSSSTSTGKNGSEQTSTAEQKGTNVSETTGRSYSKQTTTSHTEGTTTSREFSDKVASEWLEYIDEVLLQRLEYGRNKGMFQTAIYIFANQKGTLVKLGNTIKALFSGTQNNKAPLTITHLNNANEIKAIKNLQIPQLAATKQDENTKQLKLLFSKNNQKFGSWLSTNELSVITGLPQKEVVGLTLKEEVEFGLNINNRAINPNNKLLLGNLVRSGHVLKSNKVSIDRNTLNKHTFITGVTGSGKTTTCLRILESADMPFLVIEPAKTEYRVLTGTRDDVLVFTLGSENIAPFRLNPFEFFKGENISARVDMIKATIEAAFDMEAAIPQLIESAIYRCYENYGWDIATSQNHRFNDPFADGVYAFPTLSDLIEQITVEVERQGFDERLKNDYIGSIRARLQGLIVGAKGFMLNTPRSIDFLDLLERNVVLELEEIKNGAEKSLIMGFILTNLNEALKIKYKEYQSQNKTFKHITLIEEAHRLLSKYVPGDNPNKKLGVETFADMLAEVRKYGECLIIVDQIPNKLTPEVLKNTNTKIVHRIFASDDKNAIGNTMALNDDQKEFLSYLEVGRAIIFNQDFYKPIQVQIKPIESVSTTASKPITETRLQELALNYYREFYQKGVIRGLECFTKKPAIQDIKDILNMRLDTIAQAWQTVFLPPHQSQQDKLSKLKNLISPYDKQEKLSIIACYIAMRFKPYHDDLSYKDEIVRFLQEVNKGKTSISLTERNRFKI